MKTITHEILIAARVIADKALNDGVLKRQLTPRPINHHMGAVLADAILQSGLNYSTVVRPRVLRILRLYPEKILTSTLISLVHRSESARFLNWQHPKKIDRFERLVNFLNKNNIDDVTQLREELFKSEFKIQLQSLDGIGPKTIDYLGCLVGIDSIAVDRHIKSYAATTGLVYTDYTFLKNVFCYAADLLMLPRREFDAWVWQNQSSGSRSNDTPTYQLEAAI